MSPKTLIALWLLSAMPLPAAPRPWKSGDEQGSVQADFIKRDATSVTLRFATGKQIAIPLNKLHPDDRTWVNVNHPLPGTELPKPTAVFDQLTFDDTREQVLAKLKASKFVEMTLDETFLGRTGLNGVFRTRKKIGALDASLYFDWTETGKLKEITLQTEALPATDLDTKLAPCWTNFVSLLTTLHGQPLHGQAQLQLTQIQDGTFSATHLWQLEGRGSTLLGAARDGAKYQIIVRFTQKQVQPVALP